MRPIVPAAAFAALLAVASPAAAQDDPEAVACLAEAVYFEARGSGPEGLAAVAHVVLNRAKDEEFPDTPCEVVAEGCEFSYRCDGRPDRLADAEDRRDAYRIAEKVLAGEIPDPTKGALFFHEDGASSGWFETRPRVGVIGGHVFYR